MVGEYNINTASMSDEREAEIADRVEGVRFKSKLNFLNSHCGLRPGELHTITAPKGGGKSSFIRTIQSELAMRSHKSYTILSEEDRDSYTLPLNKCFKNITKDKDKAEYYLNYLIMDSLYDFPREVFSVQFIIARITWMIENMGVEVLIIDNMTTGYFEVMSHQAKDEFVLALRELCINYDIAALLVFHTQKGTNIYEKIVDGENVRGKQTAINMGSYNYILTAFFRCNPTRVFLSIDKARHHASANKTVWELNYDPSVGLFTEDIKSGEHVMKGIINAIKKADKKG